MIQINLAPGAEARRASSGSRRSLALPKLPAIGGDSRTMIAGAGAVAVLLLIAYATWSAGQHRASLEERVAVEAQDSTRFATTIDLIQALRARQDTIRQKIEVIQDVDQRRYVWPHLLDEISASVPTYTWLTQISSAEPDSASAALGFTLQGAAASTQALTGFMKNLEGSPFIRNVTLVTSEQDTDQARPVHRFTLEAQYERPDSAAIQTQPIVAVD